MERFSLAQRNLTRNGLDEFFVSENERFRLHDGVFLQHQGFDAHLHPRGEDCALVLDGTLTYLVSNAETVQARRGDLVFGWRATLHGYLNEQPEPVHLLVFTAPSRIGLDYCGDDDPQVRTFPLELRKMEPQREDAVGSEFTEFSYVTVDGTYREPGEDDVVKVFVDWESKDVSVFAVREDVVIDSASPKRLIRYVTKPQTT